MSNINTINRLHWPLIIGLGALALVRPFMNLTGLMDLIGRPAGPLLTTLLISLVWLGVVWIARVRQPLLTLLFAGLTYGIFAMILSALLSPILTGQLQGPLTNPFAFVAVLITNALWGALVGLAALALQAITHPAGE